MCACVFGCADGCVGRWCLQTDNSDNYSVLLQRDQLRSIVLLHMYDNFLLHINRNVTTATDFVGPILQ